MTLDHVITACPIHRAPHGARGLTVLVTKPDTGLIASLPALIQAVHQSVVVKG